MQAKDEPTRDVISRTGAAAGTYILRQVLGEPTWKSLDAFPERLDRAVEVLTFRDDPASIAHGLAETGLDPRCIALLSEAVAAGHFVTFRGAARVSAQAVRAINIGLRLGLPLVLTLTWIGWFGLDRNVNRPRTAGRAVTD